MTETVQVTGPYGETFEKDDIDQTYENYGHIIQTNYSCMYDPVSGQLEDTKLNCKMPVPNVNNMRPVKSDEMDSIIFIQHECPSKCTCTAEWADCEFDQNKGNFFSFQIS